MTIDTTQGYVSPEYDEKIYEFDEEEIETKMKDFITSNPNLQCLVRINNIKVNRMYTQVLKSSTNLISQE